VFARLYGSKESKEAVDSISVRVRHMHTQPHISTFFLARTAPLSFLADFLYMNHDSIYHVIDRFVAVPAMSLEIWKVVCLWRYGSHVTTAAIYTVFTITAVYAFLQSQHAQSIQDVDGFVMWHNLWHL
jgi:hypothetical protein